MRSIVSFNSFEDETYIRQRKVRKERRRSFNSFEDETFNLGEGVVVSADILSIPLRMKQNL